MSQPSQDTAPDEQRSASTAGDPAAEGHGLQRRTVLKVLGGAGAVAVGSAALAACGGSSGSSGSPAGGGSTAAPNISVAVSQVPVGGGVLLNSGQGVALVQPTSGEFKAYSAVCPHQGCAVNSFTATTITCPCHGSTFKTSDGSVINGPATSGLTPLTATVSGTNVVVT